MSDTLTLYKLILLHILDKVSFPMSNGQLSEFMLDKEYTDYFTVQTALSELVEAHFIHMKTVRNTSLYSITDEGCKTLEFFGKKISSQIQEEIADYLKEHNYELRNELSVPADYYPTGNGRPLPGSGKRLCYHRSDPHCANKGTGRIHLRPLEHQKPADVRVSDAKSSVTP